MAEAEEEAAPRKRLIIKLRLPRSGKRDQHSDEAPNDSRGQKRRQNQCMNEQHSEAGKSEAKRSRTVSSSHEEYSVRNDDADSSGAMMMNVATTGVSVATSRGKTQRCIMEYPARSLVQETPSSDSRISRTGSEERVLKKKQGAEFKKEEVEIPRVVKRMDPAKKMQCWVILKRFMVGRDGWAFKQPLDLKGLDKNMLAAKYSDSTASISTDLKKNVVKPIGFDDIESKLKKWLYPGPEEFAHDMRLVFSYALLYPPRNEIHSIGRRLSESFELSWKSLKEKWSKKERKGNKILKRGRVFAEVHNHAAREVHYKKKIQKGNIGGSRGGSIDSHWFDADKSLLKHKARSVY